LLLSEETGGMQFLQILQVANTTTKNAGHEKKRKTVERKKVLSQKDK